MKQKPPTKISTKIETEESAISTTDKVFSSNKNIITPKDEALPLSLSSLSLSLSSSSSYKIINAEKTTATSTIQDISAAEAEINQSTKNSTNETNTTTNTIITDSSNKSSADYSSVSESIPIAATTASTTTTTTDPKESKSAAQKEQDKAGIETHTSDPNSNSDRPIDLDLDYLDTKSVISLGSSSGILIPNNREEELLTKLQLFTDSIYQDPFDFACCEIIDTTTSSNETSSESSNIILPIPLEEYLEKEKQVDDFFVEGDLTAAFEALGIIDNSNNSNQSNTNNITSTTTRTLIEEQFHPLDFESYRVYSDDYSDFLLQPQDYKSVFESQDYYNSYNNYDYQNIEKEKEEHQELEQEQLQKSPYDSSQYSSYNNSSNQGESNGIKERDALYNLYHYPYQKPPEEVLAAIAVAAAKSRRKEEEEEKAKGGNKSIFVDDFIDYNGTCIITPESVAKIQSESAQSQTKEEEEEEQSKGDKTNKLLDGFIDHSGTCIITPESIDKIQSELVQALENNNDFDLDINNNNEKDNNTCIIIPESEQYSSQPKSNDSEEFELESAFLNLPLQRYQYQSRKQEESQDQLQQEPIKNMYHLPRIDETETGRQEVKEKDMIYCLPCNDGLTLTEEESIKQLKLHHEQQQKMQQQGQGQSYNMGVHNFSGLEDDNPMFTKEEILQFMNNDNEENYHYNSNNGRVDQSYFDQVQPHEQMYQEQQEPLKFEELEQLRQKYCEQQRQHQQQKQKLVEQQQQLRKQQQQLEQQQIQLQQRQRLLEQQNQQQLQQQQKQLQQQQQHQQNLQQLQPQITPTPVISRRPQALKVVEPIIQSFQTKRKNERQCFGHKESIFGVSISPCGRYCASASQDSTVCIWNMKKNKLVQALKDAELENECLRVAWASSHWRAEVLSPGGEQPQQQEKEEQKDSILASGGADGVVKVWRRKGGESKWRCMTTLDHKPTKHDTSPKTGEDMFLLSSMKGGKEELEEIPQIYSIQFIDEWKGLPCVNKHTIDTNPPSLSNSAILMTSSDDFIHLWQLVYENEDEMKFETIMDIKFTHLEHGYGGVFVHIHTGNSDSTGSKPMTPFTKSTNIITNKKSYGGDRNPDNLVFVFDAAYCPANNLLGVALSDGTLRLVNGRGVCVSILQLPGVQSHLTSFGWDRTGARLATCVATGHVILWELNFGESKDLVTPSCRAVLEGGHTEQRALFGAKFCGGAKEVRIFAILCFKSLFYVQIYNESSVFLLGSSPHLVGRWITLCVGLIC